LQFAPTIRPYVVVIISPYYPFRHLIYHFSNFWDCL
jgi:hypothetical protein